MDQIKREIKKLFNFSLRYINRTEYDLKGIIEHTEIFRSVFTDTIVDKDELIVSQLKEDVATRDILYSYLSNTAFLDSYSEVIVTITTEPELPDKGYNIALDQGTIDVLHLNEYSNGVLNTFFKAKLDEVRNAYIKEVRAKLGSIVITTGNEQDASKIAMFYFIAEDYTTCMNIIKKSCDYNELLFYCKLFLNIEDNNNFLYFSKDLNIYLRRLYFILSYSYTEEVAFTDIYNMFSRFEPKSEILRAVVELELAMYLNHIGIYKKRIPLSLFYCIDVFNKVGIRKLTEGCVKELVDLNINARVVRYCKSVRID